MNILISIITRMKERPENCFKHKYISEPKIQRNKEAAKHWLEEAKKCYGVGSYESSLNAAFVSMYRAVKALLSEKGLEEREPEYIKFFLIENFSENIKLNKFISYFEYLEDLIFSSQEDLFTDILQRPQLAQEAIRIADEFIIKIFEFMKEGE